MSATATDEGVYFDHSGPLVSRVLTVGNFRTLLDALAHTMLFVNMAVLAWKCLRLRLQGTANHVLYSALGVFFFVATSLMFMCHSCWLAGSRWSHILHAVMGALALWTGGLGIFSKCSDKRRLNQHFDIEDQEHHLSSKHSRCGLVGYLLLIPCVLTGIILLGFWNWYLKILHRLLGLFGFTCLASSMWFSYSSVYARRLWSKRWLQVLEVTTISASLLVMYEELFYLSRDVVISFSFKDKKSLKIS